MASVRSRSQSRSRTGEDSRSKRMGGVMETAGEEFPAALTSAARKETDTLQHKPTSASQSKTQSRIPQNSFRRPSISATTRPPLAHETNSWSSTNSTGRSTVTTHANTSLPGKNVNAGITQARNVLRRKKSSVSREAVDIPSNARKHSGRTSSSSSIPRSQTSVDAHAGQMDRSLTASPAEISIAHQVALPMPPTEATMIYPELDRYRNIQVPRNGPGAEMLFRLATHDLPPPTPLFSGASSHSQMSNFSGSPSTRFSESPGPGPYSRDTTPTSMSSASPSLVVPLRNPAVRARQESTAETRPPVSRRRAGSLVHDDEEFATGPQGLAVVTEALTSSSSGSTLRSGEKKERKGKTAPPNPPPRKSSQKLRKGKSNDISPSKSTMSSPPPLKSSPVVGGTTPRSVASPQSRPLPPSRPSREGTPDLYSQFGGPVPIVHSNLSSTSLTERRRSNQLAPSSLPRSTTPSQSNDRAASSKLPVSREPTPAPRSASSAGLPTTKADTSLTSRTPSPSVSGFRSRFGIFGRRKTDTDVTLGKKEKPPRKGPAAGTGHEGYGRIGGLRRRSSNAANVVRGPSGPASSSDSLTSTQSTDPFFLARLNPVVIAGGEVIENRNASAELNRTESNQSLSQPRPSVESRNGSSISISSRGDARNTLWPSAFPRDSVRSRRPSEASESDGVTMKSTLAFRRSVQRLRSSPDQEPLKLPRPINTRGITSPSLASVATTIFTDDSLALSEAEHQPAKLNASEASGAPKKLTKRVKSPRKWNLFGRSHNQSAKSKKNDEAAAVTAAVKVAPTKPVAFYTMMDSSEQEDSEEQDMGQILREAEVLLPPGLHLTSTLPNEQQESPSSKGQKEQIVSKGPEQVQTKGPDQRHAIPLVKTPARSNGPEIQAGQTSAKPPVGRPSRLPQVGRIPKVVNTRPEQTSPKSFSRPFNRISLQLPPPNPTQVDCDSIALGPSPPRPSTPELSQNASTVTTGGTVSPRQVLRHRKSRSLDFGGSGREFLAFSPRKNSGGTTSSGSTNSGIASYTYHTAVVPTATAPLAEDEIWDEYNDLLGDVPPSATSSKGVPFHLETYETRLARKVTKPLESPTIRTKPETQDAKDLRDSVEMGKAATSSSHYSADMAARINAAFHFGSDPPSTPFSVSEFVSGYGERNNNAAPTKALASQRSSSCSAKSRHTRASDCSASSEETPLSQVNLRVGSMTVSKWLTFGHVLFSPARDELIPVVGSLKRHSILVIDGLGNDDWSFYAAETYPAATFFNLSPRAPLPQEHRSSNQFPSSPSNHHQIQYNSHLEKFPFGPDSFTTVVFRFPAAAPEAHYRNIISEAQRVLKPGGYIELSVLDVDLNNMGNRTRRSVRRLKERVSGQPDKINLSSTADLILRLLGRRGFIDVKTCRVGVPVASSVTKPAVDGDTKMKKKKKDERSLAEMMNDKTEMGDENITKMVAKVGRWWYSRLYETPTGIAKSIWDDRLLLAECEEWNTSLKLMVCYAKVPETRGRVSSI
ncbi:hypothetical protein JX266_004878 [Neoarthrinium moseri]|nr:hypothetical protein JX266_004878 [Neoarthrinium moseri]